MYSAPSKKGPGLVNSNRLYKKVYPRGFYECTFKLYVVFIYIIAFTMASQFMNSVADTLTKKPEYGIVSSMLSITMSTTQVLQLVGIIIGLFIAVITAVLKVMELREKLAERRKAKRLKKLVEEAREEEEE